MSKKLTDVSKDLTDKAWEFTAWLATLSISDIDYESDRIQETSRDLIKERDDQNDNIKKQWEKYR